MSDKYNTPAHQDPQISRKRAEMTGDYEKESGDEFYAGTADLYAGGIKILDRLKIVIEQASDGFYNVYRADTIESLPGLKIPVHFSPLQLLTTPEQFWKLGQDFKNLTDNEELRKFWSPLWESNKPNEPLFEYAKYLARQNQNAKKKRVFEYNHTLDPSGKKLLGKTSFCTTPKTWLPALQWFDPKVAAEVTFEDVFSLFPYAEQQILKLLIGRVAVGRKNQMYPNSDRLIKHTARMLGIILGTDAGLI